LNFCVVNRDLTYRYIQLVTLYAGLADVHREVRA